jgi:limonene-1,2-epoxide hydrolase
MRRAPGDLVRAFAGAVSSGDVGSLEPFLDDDIDATFDEAGALSGRRTVLAFWRRLFETYVRFEMHIVRLVEEGSVVIAEAVYILHMRRGGSLSVRAMALFEIEKDRIVRWTDHADLADVSPEERRRWRRLGAAKW